MPRMVGLSIWMSFAVACGGRILDAGEGDVGDSGTDAASAVDATHSDASSTEPTQSNGVCGLVPPSDPGNPATGCSVVGSWLIVDGYTHATALIAFNADGSFYGGPPGTDLSQTYTFDGQYRMDPSTSNTLDVLTSCGLNCGFDGTFTTQFQNNCSFLKLHTVIDNCTGGRQYLRDSPTLTRQ